MKYGRLLWFIFEISFSFALGLFIFIILYTIGENNYD